MLSRSICSLWRSGCLVDAERVGAGGASALGERPVSPHFQVDKALLVRGRQELPGVATLSDVVRNIYDSDTGPGFRWTGPLQSLVWSFTVPFREDLA
jgi:hypothetical protein